MRKIKKNLGWIFVFLLLILIFKNWFWKGVISSGDAPFWFSEVIKKFPSFPFLWAESGLGNYQAVLAHFFYFIFLPKLVSFFNLSWEWIERICFYWLFLAVGIFSSWYLAKKVIPHCRFKFLSVLIYLLNTYILMIVSGGQVSVFLAYAVAPLVLGLFINLLTNSNVEKLKSLIAAGLALGFQVGFEPRIALITMMAFGFYCMFFINVLKNLRILVRLVFSGLIAVFLHFYWIFPGLVLKKAPFSSEVIAPYWISFLSFASFSNTFSLLHPFWPENIFGKTYFMKPEFLILPILAFINLFFINKLNTRLPAGQVLRLKKNILFFCFLAIIGAFLAKGINPPLGEIYRWLFNNVPGMNLFRDSTKFYLLVCLSYSVLIPLGIFNIYKWINPKSKIQTPNSRFKIQTYLSNLFLLFTICYLIFLIQAAILGDLRGAFKAKEIPKEYLVLKDFLGGQEGFFRTFWVPKHQRFGFFSAKHPAISSENFLTDSVCKPPFCELKMEMPARWGEKCFPNDRCYVRELSYFLNPKTADVLGKMGVKYIIVPLDSEGEIFIAEHQYNPQQREEVEEFLDTIPWLKKIAVADRIAVYELAEYKDHFFIEDSGVNTIKGWKKVNPTKYLVSLKINRVPVSLIFSETYEELWKLRYGEETISSRPYMGILNSFLIDKTGEFEVIIEFTGQKYVNYGLIVSGFALVLIIGYLIIKYYKLRLMPER
jgi:hypothetical protein